MTDRPDLAAMISPLSRALIDAELPVLHEHGLSMWAYSVLLALDERPLRTQAALAESIGADKTRIIGVLDDLQRRGLIERTPTPPTGGLGSCRLTAEGRRVRDSAQAGIRRGEERLLARLSAEDRRGFLRALQALAALSPEEIAGA